MSDEKLLISVIVPCFNQSQFLADTLNSIVGQTRENWECLIIDDGSFDSTPNVASQFVRRDSRFRYLHHANRGLAATRNVGLSQARGDLIQFLDSDDVILRDKFERQVAALGSLDSLKAIHCDYSTGRVDRITEPGEAGLPPNLIYRKPIHDLAFRWETDLSIPVHCFLFDSRIFRDYGIRFDESLANHEDWECWMRVFALETESVFVDRRLAIYRRSGRMTSNHRAMYAGFLAALTKQSEIWKHDPTMRGLLKVMRRRIEHLYRPRLRREGTVSDLRGWCGDVYKRNVPWPLQQAVSRYGKPLQQLVTRYRRLEPSARLRRAIS